MESSDESFLWTDASNDFNSDSKMARDENCDIESESGYSYKQKLQKKLFDKNEENGIEGVNMKKKSKKRKYSNIDSTDGDAPKRKHIKSEPESDVDKHHKMNKSQILNNDNTINDENFLNYKVKEEQMVDEKNSPQIKKKKKKKHKVDNADSHGDEPESNTNDTTLQNNDISVSNNEHNDSYLETEQVTETNRLKKKKAKKKIDKEYKRNKLLEEENTIEQTVHDDNTMDTTILDQLCKTEQISSNNKVLLQKSQSFVENDDEGEISTINSSYLNTTDQKQIKNALSQNGDNNDMMLSCGGKISKERLKISDRITFEDEETSEFDNDSRMSKSNNTKCSVQIQKYFKAHEHLIEVSPPIKSDCVISDDDEIWVLECPSDIDVKNLKGSSLVIDTKCKLKVESQTYVGVSESDTNTVTILTIGGSKPVIKNVPLSGLIHLHKRVPKAHFVEDNNMINNQTNFIPLPDTKCRHPLFGVNYKNAIKVPKNVAERLYGMDSEPGRDDGNEKTKKVKKKRKMKTNLSDIEDEAKSEREVRKEKKKSRKRSRDSTTPPKPAKRRKHDPESVATWDSEKAIEQQLFNF